MTWPGDKALYFGGPAAYPWLKNVAVDTGEALFQSVMAEHAVGRGSEELIIVAHSLGCRVTLEFLERLHRAGRPARLRRVVVILMAAAVPVEMDTLIRRAVSASDSVVVLHSSSDWALKLWFRFGQTFAGEGHMPEAIGLNGLPHDPGWAGDWQMIGFGHSDYWVSNETAEIIGLALRRHVPGIVLRNDPERVRTLPLPPSLPSRDLLALHDLARSADAARR
jgi:pimeloyl-ACP methyl ester carboxylesterase